MTFIVYFRWIRKECVPLQREIIMKRNNYGKTDKRNTHTDW